MEILRILETAMNAILPIVLLMALGYWLHHKKILGSEFISQGNTLTFRLLLPCMLFANVYDIEGFGVIPWDAVIYSVAAGVALCLLGMGIAMVTTRIPERRGVIAQSVFRSNLAIIGLPLAGTLGGEEATAVTSVISAFTIALFNMLAVIVLTVFLKGNGKQKIRPLKILRDIITNPPIIGILLGFGCMAIRTAQIYIWGDTVFSLKEDFRFLYSAISNLRSITSPFALLVLGGQFRFSAIRGLWKELAVGTFCRLVMAPALGIGTAVLLTHLGVLHIGTHEYPALIALLGSPVAVGSETMAGQMGNDRQLATQLVVWTSLLSIVTLFCIVCLMMALGLLSI